MNVYVVLSNHAPRVFADEAGALAWGRANAAREIHECPLQGAPAPELQVIRHGTNGATAALPVAQHVVHFAPSTPLDERVDNHAPGQPPPNRVAPAFPADTKPCQFCSAPMPAAGSATLCNRCCKELAGVQGWPTNAPALPTPGAEFM